MTFSTFTVLCNYRDCLVLEHFFTQKQTCVHEAVSHSSFLPVSSSCTIFCVFVDKHLGCFYFFLFVWFLAIVDNAAMNVCVSILCAPMFLLGIHLEVALLGRIVILFDLLRNHQTVHSGCHILYSSQQHCSPTPPSLFQDLSHLENGTPTSRPSLPMRMDTASS